MKIPLPAGYASATPFDRAKHKRLGIPPDAAKFASALNVIYITTAEFSRACHDYSIAFVRDGTGNVVPIIVTGLADGTNLYIDEQGVWASDTYCPAFVRRYPFFTVTMAGATEDQALICVDEKALSRDAPALVNAAGEPTGKWRDVELLVTEMDSEQQNTAALCSSIEQLDLLEPFEADFHPRGKPQIRVAGFLWVNERRSRSLSETDVMALMRNGHLARIYAHLLSFENFNHLLNRYIAR